jgi:hypothetical protein
LLRESGAADAVLGLACGKERVEIVV